MSLSTPGGYCSEFRENLQRWHKHRCAAVYKELEKEESVRKLKGYAVSGLLQILRTYLTPCGLSRFEKVKRIHVTLDAGTIENGCITPTFKIRR